MTENDAPNSLGLAISGGGHRATAFALGVLLYLVDTGLNHKVRTITSVSGGSILNAFVALARSADGEKQPFSSFSPAVFDEHAVKLAALLAGRPRLWWIAVMIASGGAVLVTLLLLLRLVDKSTALLFLATLFVVISIWIGPKSGGSLWAWPGTWLYCGFVVWLAIAALVFAGYASLWGAEVVVPLILIGWLFQKRNWIAERAYEHTVCRLAAGKKPAGKLRLEDMNTAVKHVFCATEMHSGQHAYFSHDFVYARGWGLGRPGGLPVATAVQVSANFPGGFPIRPLRASRFAFFLTDRFQDTVVQGHSMGLDILMTAKDYLRAVALQEFVKPRPLPKWLMLSDGGVYDNLAVDWYLQSESRVSLLRMSLNWNYRGATGPGGEADWFAHGTNEREPAILAPLRDAPECLIAVNAGLTTHWRHGEAAIVSLPFIGEVLGLSQISETMYNNYTKDRIRSLADHAVLELGFGERLVRTTLLPLGTETTARLLSAGYAEAMYFATKKFGHTLINVDVDNLTLLAQGKRGVRTLKPFSLHSSRSEPSPPN